MAWLCREVTCDECWDLGIIEPVLLIIATERKIETTVNTREHYGLMMLEFLSILLMKIRRNAPGVNFSRTFLSIQSCNRRINC